MFLYFCISVNIYGFISVSVYGCKYITSSNFDKINLEHF